MGTAAVVPVDGLIGACSKSAQWTTTDLVSTVTQALLVAGVPTGPLKTFLSATYADMAACDLAWRAIGGRFDVRLTAGTASTSALLGPIWVASTSTPSLSMTQIGTTNAVYEVTLSTIHTLVQ